MPGIAVVTDSNSGITQDQADKLGVYVIPMPFTINGDSYFEDINLTQKQFYRMLADNAEIHTSQPLPSDVTDLWDRLLREYDGVVHIPMSSGLSGACSSAAAFAQEYDGRVQVVNNQRISVTQRQSVLEAKYMGEHGSGAARIKEVLEKTRFDSSIYITLDTLKYLKKGGRVTAAAAAFAEILNVKPVLQINGEKLDAYAKARGMKAAKGTMIKAMRDDIEKKYGGIDPEHPKVWLEIAHTDNEEEAEEFSREVREAFPGHDVIIAPLSLSISCHIGPGSLALACTQALEGGIPYGE